MCIYIHAYIYEYIYICVTFIKVLLICFSLTLALSFKDL